MTRQLCCWPVMELQQDEVHVEFEMRSKIVRETGSLPVWYTFGNTLLTINTCLNAVKLANGEQHLQATFSNEFLRKKMFVFCTGTIEFLPKCHFGDFDASILHISLNVRYHSTLFRVLQCWLVTFQNLISVWGLHTQIPWWICRIWAPNKRPLTLCSKICTTKNMSRCRRHWVD